MFCCIIVLSCYCNIGCYTCSFILTVPAVVTSLRIENEASQDSLTASWERPAGDVDGYQLTLSAGGSVLQERNVSSNATEALFEQLIPGQSYSISVSTISGVFSTRTNTVGQTSENISLPY